jgi:hypothetical protein
MHGFKTWKDRLMLAGDNAADDLQLRSILIYHSKNPRVLKSNIKL